MHRLEILLGKVPVLMLLKMKKEQICRMKLLDFFQVSLGRSLEVLSALLFVKVMSCSCHLSQPQVPVSLGWHIHCQKLWCKWSRSLRSGRPRWHSCWTWSCSCSGWNVPCCRTPPRCILELPQLDPTCWEEHLSCSRPRFEDSGECMVLETRE